MYSLAQNKIPNCQSDRRSRLLNGLRSTDSPAGTQTGHKVSKSRVEKIVEATISLESPSLPPSPQAPAHQRHTSSPPPVPLHHRYHCLLPSVASLVPPPPSPSHRLRFLCLYLSASAVSYAFLVQRPQLGTHPAEIALMSLRKYLVTGGIRHTQPPRGTEKRGSASHHRTPNLPQNTNPTSLKRTLHPVNRGPIIPSALHTSNVGLV